MQADGYIKIINEKMNKKFWMAGFLVIPKVYAVIESPFRKKIIAGGLNLLPVLVKNLISSSVKDYIQKRRGQAILFSFEYIYVICYQI